jgi:hypothetical protein
MKRLGFTTIFLLLFCNGYAQGADTLLEGHWELFQIIDNMTGDNIKPTHKSSEKFSYWIDFNGDLVKYNLEVNKCENEIIVGKDRSIEFKFFADCSKICCDENFSELLTYTECTKYYIKKGQTLIMVSEDRIFYFSRIN